MCAVAEGFSDADRDPPTFDPATHTVRIPESFKKSLRAWQSAEWFRVGLREEVGGIPAPAMVTWAITEFLLGAQPGIYFYLTGPVFSGILYGIGTAEQRRWATLAVERNWGSTTVLTEPDAGSDVGAGRTRAIPQADGSWHIEGVKRFITSADSDDLFENIAHLVLARPVGLKVSATCEITLGGHGIPAKGWLIGDTHNGIAQMFQVSETARMMVGTKEIYKVGTGSVRFLFAVGDLLIGWLLLRQAEIAAAALAMDRIGLRLPWVQRLPACNRGRSAESVRPDRRVRSG